MGSLTTKVKAIYKLGVWKFALDTAAKQLSAMNSITASPDFLGKIASELRYRPEIWLYLGPDHPFYAQTYQDIADIYPKLPEKSIILVHSSNRWCLATDGANLVPMVFLQRPEACRLYKVIHGKASKWVVTLLKEIGTLLVEGKYAGAVELKQVRESTQPTSSSLAQPLSAVSDLTGAGFRQ